MSDSSKVTGHKNARDTGQMVGSDYPIIYKVLYIPGPLFGIPSMNNISQVFKRIPVLIFGG